MTKKAVYTTKNEKDLRGKSLPDLHEKRLIVARYFIKWKNAGKEFKEKDIYYMWNNYFPNDFRFSKKYKLKLQENTYNGRLVLLEPSVKISEDVINDYSNKWVKIYDWIIKYVRTHTLEECDIDIRDIRKRNHRMLIQKYKPFKYIVKDTTAKVSDSRVAMYHIFQYQTKKRSGSYENLMEYANKINEGNKR